MKLEGMNIYTSIAIEELENINNQNFNRWADQIKELIHNNGYTKKEGEKNHNQGDVKLRIEREKRGI